MPVNSATPCYSFGVNLRTKKHFNPYSRNHLYRRRQKQEGVCNLGDGRGGENTICCSCLLKTHARQKGIPFILYFGLKPSS